MRLLRARLRDYEEFPKHIDWIARGTGMKDKRKKVNHSDPILVSYFSLPEASF